MPKSHPPRHTIKLAMSDPSGEGNARETPAAAPPALGRCAQTQLCGTAPSGKHGACGMQADPAASTALCWSGKGRIPVCLINEPACVLMASSHCASLAAATHHAVHRDEGRTAALEPRLLPDTAPILALKADLLAQAQPLSRLNGEQTFKEHEEVL